MTVDRAALARRIREVAYLTGQFTLRSGATSTFYWDKYRFESDPAILAAVTEAMLPILPASYDKLAGLELGGIPLATSLSLQSGKPCLYVRKEAKSYGTSNLVEGGHRQGERVVVIEDVITSGGQVVHVGAADARDRVRGGGRGLRDRPAAGRPGGDRGDRLHAPAAVHAGGA